MKKMFGVSLIAITMFFAIQAQAAADVLPVVGVGIYAEKTVFWVKDDPLVIKAGGTFAKLQCGLTDWSQNEQEMGLSLKSGYYRVWFEEAPETKSDGKHAGQVEWVVRISKNKWIPYEWTKKGGPLTKDDYDKNEAGNGYNFFSQVIRLTAEQAELLK